VSALWALRRPRDYGPPVWHAIGADGRAVCGRVPEWSPTPAERRTSRRSDGNPTCWYCLRRVFGWYSRPRRRHAA